MKKIIVFDYLDYRKLLKDLFDWYKKQNSGFSHRYFANKSGLSIGFLKLVIDGKRNLTKKSLMKIAKGFELNDEEIVYFENLVFMNQSKKVSDKDYYYKNLIKNGDCVKSAKITKDQYKYFSNWYNCVIRELAVFNNSSLLNPDRRACLAP